MKKTRNFIYFFSFSTFLMLYTWFTLHLTFSLLLGPTLPSLISLEESWEQISLMFHSQFKFTIESFFSFLFTRTKVSMTTFCIFFWSFQNSKSYCPSMPVKNMFAETRIQSQYTLIDLFPILLCKSLSDCFNWEFARLRKKLPTDEDCWTILRNWIQSKPKL